MNLNDLSRAARNDILWAALILFGSIVVYILAFFLIKKEWGGRQRVVLQLFQTYLYRPGFLLVIALALNADLDILKKYISLKLYEGMRHFLLIVCIAVTAVLVIRAVSVFRDIVLNHYAVREHDEYTIRKAKTKFQIMQRVFSFLIALTTVAIILMTFKNIRQVGGTLLASAGVVGLVLGFAAQKSLGTLFAGIQIAISQPIRLDDVVVVEGQFGTIGEITLTYVVVYRWDGRRLVVPINYFLEKSFESWTRSSPEVVGKVKIYADYTLPVEKIRQEFKKWIEDTELWDRRRQSFLVTSANEWTIEVRATMSARDSDDAFDLECLIREKLIAYIRENYPESLPRLRINIGDVLPDPKDQLENFRSAF